MPTFLHIIISLFAIVFFSCSEQGWSKEEIKSLKSRCEDTALKEQGISKKDLEQLKRIESECDCVSDKFTNQFSFEEYTKMTEEPITESANSELVNKIEIYLKTTLDECGIVF